MPIYEYFCESCGVIEVFQKMSDKELKTCPTCKSKIEKQLSTPASPKFTGSGFYETDYKKKS